MGHRIIIYDFEVFKYDTLLGAVIIDEGVKVYQTWNLEEIKNFYLDNKESIWIGHNISRYDNIILQAVVQDKDPYKTSKEIINQQKKKYLNIPLIYYDLIANRMVALKMVEAADGKNISESKIDFDIDRPLFDDEKREVEAYNLDDLDQTLDDFIATESEFTLRLDIINEFNLNIRKSLSATGTQLAEEVLHAEYTNGIETWVVKPKMYDTLRLQNKELINFYMNEEFASGKKLKIMLCGVEHTIGIGGIHGAEPKCHLKEALYFDVSGYYNLIMILLDLLPRSIPLKYKELYKNMYEQQLVLKKTNPKKRWVFKTILLSVFGAMFNEWCKFYDPYHARLVTMTGQIFIVDLLEKLEGKIRLIQSNTDGIIAVPLEGISEQEIRDIINEWQTRTGFNLAIKKVYDIHQRDVNNYFYRDDEGKIKCLGEAVTYYNTWKEPFWNNSYKTEEALILQHCIVDYFMFGILPEETVEKNKRNLQMFQYICRRNSFDWLEYTTTSVDGTVETTRLQHVNRAFAMKDETKVGMVYKRKKDGKKQKGISIIKSVFVYNQEILSDEAVDKLIDKIDYDYYVKRAYDRIKEFINFPLIKDVRP